MTTKKTSPQKNMQKKPTKLASRLAVALVVRKSEATKNNKKTSQIKTSPPKKHTQKSTKKTRKTKKQPTKAKQ